MAGRPRARALRGKDGGPGPVGGLLPDPVFPLVTSFLYLSFPFHLFRRTAGLNVPVLPNLVGGAVQMRTRPVDGLVKCCERAAGESGEGSSRNRRVPLGTVSHRDPGDDDSEVGH